MNQSTITPAQYLERFKHTREDQQKLLSEPGYNLRRPSTHTSCNVDTTMTTFAISFRQIQTQSLLAYLVLRTIACIDSWEVPHELLATLDGEDDEMRLGQALAKLHNFSLLSVTRGDTGKTYTVHSLVHLAIQYHLSSQEKSIALAETSRRLATVIPDDGRFENWVCLSRCNPHVMAFLHYAGEAINTPEIASVCYSIGDYLLETTRYSDAEQLAQKSIKIFTHLLGEEHQETLKARCMLANIYRLQGRHSEAETFIGNCLKSASEPLVKSIQTL